MFVTFNIIRAQIILVSVLILYFKQNKTFMKKNNKLTIGLAVGIGIGTAVGIATGNLGLWISVGIAIGAGIGTTLNKNNKPEESDKP